MNLVVLTEKCQKATKNLFLTLKNLNNSFDTLELEHSQLITKVAKLKNSVKEWRKQDNLLSGKCSSLNATLQELRQKTKEEGIGFQKTKKDQAEALRRAKAVAEKVIADEKVKWDKKKKKVVAAEIKVKQEKTKVSVAMASLEALRIKVNKRETSIIEREESCKRFYKKLLSQEKRLEDDRISFEKDKLGAKESANVLVEQELLAREADLKKKKRDLFFISKNLKGRLENVKKKEKAIEMDRIRLEDRIKTFEAHS